MTRCIEPTAVTPPVAASRPRTGAAIPHRHSGVAAAALLLALSATPIEAQPRPAATRAHVGGATFFEAARHFNAGASYRKYFGARGWALEPEYAFMTEGSHQDHMLILNMVKDLAPLSRKAVPYVVMGAGINLYRGFFGQRRHSGVSPGGVAFGLGLMSWIGDRVFVAPELRIGFEPNVRYSVSLGFAPRR